MPASAASTASSPRRRFREAVRYLVKGLLWVHETRSEEAVFGCPSVVEVDVLVRDGERILQGEY